MNDTKPQLYQIKWEVDLVSISIEYKLDYEYIIRIK